MESRHSLGRYDFWVHSFGDRNLVPRVFSAFKMAAQKKILANAAGQEFSKNIADFRFQSNLWQAHDWLILWSHDLLPATVFSPRHFQRQGGPGDEVGGNEFGKLTNSRVRSKPTRNQINRLETELKEI